MPFGRTWSEELVAEWLQLEGYKVEIGFPLFATERGGLREADVVGTRIKEGLLEVVHAEVGTLSRSFDENVKTIKKKFDNQTNSIIENYAKHWLGKSPSKHHKIFVYEWLSRANEIKKYVPDVEILSISEVIDKFVQAINQWTKKPPYQIKGKSVTIPGSLWLAKVAEAVEKRKQGPSYLLK